MRAFQCYIPEKENYHILRTPSDLFMDRTKAEDRKKQKTTKLTPHTSSIRHAPPIILTLEMTTLLLLVKTVHHYHAVVSNRLQPQLLTGHTFFECA